MIFLPQRHQDTKNLLALENPKVKADSSCTMKHKNLIILATAFLAALVPFLFWRATWFGRSLSDQEIDKYLAGDKPLHVQHALSQVSERIVAGRIRPDDAARWYPRIAALSRHASPEIRSTDAWVMGQDNTSEEFHRALLGLLRDPEPLVRRNAALSLVRFGDPGARAELLLMLRPYPIRSPQSGKVTLRLAEQEAANPGTLLARLEVGAGEKIEIRSPLPGLVDKKLVVDGQSVEAGAPIMVLAPAPEQVWEALRALVLVGRSEDLPEVERLVRGRAGEGSNDKISQQAELTIRAIRARP